MIFSNQSALVDDGEFRSTVDEIIRNLKELPRVTSAVSFFDTDDPAMVSSDRHAVLGEVVLEAESRNDLNDVSAVVDTVKAANGEGGSRLAS